MTKPLAPEKLNLMNEEEKRLYNIQKGKYDTYVRILQKKADMNELPGDRKFKLADTEMLLNGKHHDDDDDVELMHEAEINMQYLGRDDTFRQ